MTLSEHDLQTLAELEEDLTATPFSLRWWLVGGVGMALLTVGSWLDSALGVGLAVAGYGCVVASSVAAVRWVGPRIRSRLESVRRAKSAARSGADRSDH